MRRVGSGWGTAVWCGCAGGREQGGERGSKGFVQPRSPSSTSCLQSSGCRRPGCPDHYRRQARRLRGIRFARHRRSRH
ncbi:hypothetical protein BCR44DRAFT_1238461 [Catenaria anguillulae PL171]|uniref:Uncharacterized protein n=1 Tax=Catenaria anguillulae PL171 TaxID=765915 RepID=A0A1Y2HCY7_9FUNG|nr:hypothetical protein BCR44DRAFT_1238461 [Catenaria anguillulae PL171]